MGPGRASTSEPLWLDADQQRSWRALVVGTTLLMHHFDEELRRDFGLSLTEYEVLVRLSESEQGELRMAQVAESLCLSRSRITHTVARMEAGGLVERRASSDDGRGVVARITPTGRSRLLEASPAHVSSVRAHLVDLVDAEDFAAMGRVMNAAADDLLVEHPDADIR